MSEMDELKLLRKAAESAVKMQAFKKKYDKALMEYQRSHPLADDRRNRKNIEKRAKVIAPLYEQFKEHKRQFEGYIFMWSQKEKL